MHDILTWMLNIYREGYRWGEHEQKVSKYQAKKNRGLLCRAKYSKSNRPPWMICISSQKNCLKIKLLYTAYSRPCTAMYLVISYN